MKLNWNFLGGVGCKTKTFHGGSMDIFWNYTLEERKEVGPNKNEIHVGTGRVWKPDIFRNAGDDFYAYLKALGNGQPPLPLKMINIFWQWDRP